MQRLGGERTRRFVGIMHALPEQWKATTERSSAQRSAREIRAPFPLHCALLWWRSPGTEKLRLPQRQGDASGLRHCGWELGPARGVRSGQSVGKYIGNAKGMRADERYEGERYEGGLREEQGDPEPLAFIFKSRINAATESLRTSSLALQHCHLACHARRESQTASHSQVCCPATSPS